jgi:hypothetical protein
MNNTKLKICQALLFDIITVDRNNCLTSRQKIQMI